MEKYDTLGLLLAGGIALLVLWAIIAALNWFASLFARKKPMEIPPEAELENALQIAGTPRPVLGTSQWMHYECKPVFCDPPRQFVEPYVHDTTDPKHNRKTCPVCNERPTYSGANMTRSN